jgi:PAS domain S-box-containing protein
VGDPLIRPSYTPLLHEDLEDLYEHAPCGYLSTDADGVILKANHTFWSLTGYDRDEWLGRRRFTDLLTIGGRIFHETHLRPLLRMQGYVREIALDLTRHDGTQLPILVNASERRPAGEPEGVAIVRLTVFDATDRRRYERELLAARRQAEEAAQGRTDLIGMISHDLRAPLSALVTAAAMLERTPLSEAQARYVRVMQSSVTHALTLLISILTLNSVEAGRGAVREKPFSVRELVEHAAAAATVAAASKADLRIDIRVDNQTPERVIGDGDKLLQVLMNLVGNAVKFTERGAVRLVVRPEEGGWVRFAVSDTGPGIAAEDLGRLFQAFTQLHTGLTRRYGGTGLGLYISRRLAELLGGYIEVESHVGQGSRFSLVLPPATPPRPDAVAAED